MPAGAVVGLEYDPERTAGYGRTLTGVLTTDGTPANAELARAGLGTPMVVEPHRKFLPPAEESFAQAKPEQAGLLDPAHGCTRPARAPEAAPKPNIVNEAPPGYYADIPGYTGPRCYAPGGKFFKPC